MPHSGQEYIPQPPVPLDPASEEEAVERALSLLSSSSNVELVVGGIWKTSVGIAGATGWLSSKCSLFFEVTLRSSPLGRGLSVTGCIWRDDSLRGERPWAGGGVIAWKLVKL